MGIVEDTRFSFKYITVENNSTYTASFGHCLPGLYMNKTSSKTEEKLKLFTQITSWIRKYSNLTKSCHCAHIRG